MPIDVANKLLAESRNTTPRDTLVEAARKAQRALKPITDMVFNDNGDHTILTAPFEDTVYSNAYFASKALDAALKDTQQAEGRK